MAALYLDPKAGPLTAPLPNPTIQEEKKRNRRPRSSKINKTNKSEQVLTDAVPFTNSGRDDATTPTPNAPSSNQRSPPRPFNSRPSESQPRDDSKYRSQNEARKAPPATPSSPTKENEGKSTNSRSRTSFSFNGCGNVHLGDNNTLNYVSVPVANKAPNTPKKRKPKKTKEASPSKDIPEQLLKDTRKLNPETIVLMSQHIGMKWKDLGMILPQKNRFTRQELERIQFDNPYHLRDAISCMLNEWVERDEEQATIGNLANSLGKVGLSKVAQKLGE